MGHVVQRGDLVRDVAGSAARGRLVSLQHGSQLLAGPQYLQLLPEDRALAADHLVEVPLLDLHVMPLRRVQRCRRLHAGQLVEVADKHQGRDPLRRAPLSDEPLEKLPAQLAHLLYDEGPHDLQRLVDRLVGKERPVHGVHLHRGGQQHARPAVGGLPDGLVDGRGLAAAGWAEDREGGPPGGGLFERVVLGFVWPPLSRRPPSPRLPLPQPLADRLQDLFRDPCLLPRQRCSARLRRRFVELAVEVALDQALVREQHGRDVPSSSSARMLAALVQWPGRSR